MLSPIVSTQKQCAGRIFPSIERNQRVLVTVGEISIPVASGQTRAWRVKPRGLDAVGAKPTEQGPLSKPLKPNLSFGNLWREGNGQSFFRGE